MFDGRINEKGKSHEAIDVVDEMTDEEIVVICSRIRALRREKFEVDAEYERRKRAAEEVAKRAESISEELQSLTRQLVWTEV